MNLHRSVKWLGIFLLSGLPIALASTLLTGSWASVEKSFEIKYKIVHTLHEVEGVSTTGEARGVVSPELVQVQVRVPVNSFDSANANRDSNAMSVVDAARFPYVSFKATGKPCDLQNGQCDMSLKGTLDFHGIKRDYDAQVKLKENSDGKIQAEFSFPVILTAHNIERPSLMFMPIEDEMVITGTVQMERSP